MVKNSIVAPLGYSLVVPPQRLQKKVSSLFCSHFSVKTKITVDGELIAIVAIMV